MPVVQADLLYPAVPPRRSLMLPVSHGHVLQVQDSGNPDGMCALVLHGGPGSGLSPLLQRFFDPARFRIIGIDQRGAGRSQPRGSTAHNTTAELLEDLRRVRAHLGIARWLVVGGSWGATLALAHALDEPDAVAALLLRAVFVPSAEDIAAFFQDTAGRASAAWTRFAAVALASERDDMLGFLHRCLQADPAQGIGERRRELALAWWHWERAMTGASAAPTVAEPAGVEPAVADPAAATEPAGEALAALVDRYRVQSHYLLHRCWLDAPPLLDRLHALPRVPTLLLHARDDRICPAQGAQAVHARIAHSRLQWVDGGGHDPAAPAMASAMLTALDGYARHGHFGDVDLT
jgi:proline iminopeptidase